MANEKHIKKQASQSDDTDGKQAAERGKAAIEAGKKSGAEALSDDGKKGKDEKKDAENWRNEG